MAEMSRNPARAFAEMTGRLHGDITLIVGSTPLFDAVAAGALEGAAARGASAQIYLVGREAAPMGMEERVAVYRGSAVDLLRDIPIAPTLAVVGGSDELATVEGRLAHGARAIAPEDAARPPGWIEESRGGGLVAWRLLAPGRPRIGLSREGFGRLIASLAQANGRTLREATGGARRELAFDRASRRGIGPWPWEPPECPLPPSMPGGHPWPRISVVTPSFNQGAFIEETILSVANQGYPNVEHIVVDGGSTDATRGVIERHRPNLARTLVEPDAGQSDAINKGFALATGSILTWLNSDDMLAPGALAAVALAFETSGADVVAGVCRLQRAGETVQEHMTSCDDGPLPLDDLLDLEGCWLAGQFFYQPEVMFTRRIFDLAGGRVDPGAFYSMDYDLWVRLARVGARLHVIGRPVALYRVHEGQKTATPEGYRAELPRVRDRHLRELGGQEPRPPRSRGKGKLRIAFFNDIGFQYGAGIAHRRIAASLMALGHEVVPIAGMRADPQGDLAKVAPGAVVSRLAEVEADLVVCGNFHGAGMGPDVLAAISARFETAFVMHDLWLLTGRCAYPGNCGRYRLGCDEACDCPGHYPRLDAREVRRAWEMKRLLLTAERPPVLLADSRWLAGEARRTLGVDPRIAAEGGASGRAMPEIDWIRYGFELDVFTPRDRVMCRELLGLPRDRFIIATASASVRDPRKGLSHLAESLLRLDLPDVLVVAAGWFGRGEAPPIPGMRALGYTEDPRRLAMLYSAADLFVGPSLEEAFGQVYVEAAACGTPSVGYPVGGVPEALADGISGRIAAGVSPAALADAIEELYDDGALRRCMGAWGRAWAESEWSMESAGHRFMGALRTMRVGERLGIARKTGFVLPRPAVPPVQYIGGRSPRWTPVSGFGAWQGEIPTQRIPRSIWSHGPVSSFEIEAEKPEKCRLVVTYRCWIEGQRVRLARPPAIIGESAVETTPELADKALEFELWLRKGTNRFEFHFSKWYLGLEGPPVAMLVTAIEVVVGQPAPGG